MALSSSTADVLSSMLGAVSDFEMAFYPENITANCSIATDWYYAHHLDWLTPSDFESPNDAINIDFERTWISPNSTLLEDSSIASYTDLIYNTTVLPNGTNEMTVDLQNVLVVGWVIEYNCLAPALAQQIPSIFNLPLTQNCSTLFNYYFGNNTDAAFRDKMPQKYQNISEIELWEWYQLVATRDEFDYVPPNGQSIPLTPEAQLVAGWLKEANNQWLQEACTPYVQGNTDLAGIGVSLFSRFQRSHHLMFQY